MLYLFSKLQDFLLIAIQLNPENATRNFEAITIDQNREVRKTCECERQDQYANYDCKELHLSPVVPE